MEILKREIIYLWFYIDIQLRQLFIYWLIGILIGSFISVFAKDKIHRIMSETNEKKWGLFGIVPACVLGIISPLCMYGTIPIAASFAKKGMREDYIASFCMASILLNPQLIIYSMALGNVMVVIRIVSCVLCGVVAGLLVYIFYHKKNKKYFGFSRFDEPMQNRDVDNNLFIRYLKNVFRNVKATGLYFAIGIILSALFQIHVPEDVMVNLFGGNKAWGVLMAATIGVPLYVCGGGTIPLLLNWLSRGMSVGAATSFMITGPATKITNLGALKICLGIKNFIIYLVYTIVFSLISGFIINIIVIGTL
ncbi:MAG: permease [Lachnospiraceae bacterium]|nr:permease [Lachnospiraceae bacterium]